MNLRIALISPTAYPFNLGGVEVYTHELALLLIERKISVEVITLSKRSDPHNLPYKLHHLNASCELPKHLQENQYDIGHFQLLTDGAFDTESFLNARKILPKIGLTCHLPGMTCISGEYLEQGVNPCRQQELKKCTRCYVAYRYPLPKTLATISATNFVRKTFPRLDIENKIKAYYDTNKRVFDAADFVFSLADWYSNMLADFGVSLNKIYRVNQILPNQQNLAKLEDEELLTDNNTTSILFIGRLAKEKGINTLISAWKTANTDRLSLNFVGPMRLNGKDRSEFLRFVADHKEVCYSGPVDSAQVAHEVHRHNFVILPSTCSEMSPLVLAEAKALGKTIIGSDSPGIYELLDDTYDYVFQRKATPELTTILNKINDGHLKPTRKRVSFDNSTIADAVEKVYRL